LKTIITPCVNQNRICSYNIVRIYKDLMIFETNYTFGPYQIEKLYYLFVIGTMMTNLIVISNFQKIIE